MQSKQRVGDLEEELELLQKQLQTMQMKVVHQVKNNFNRKKKLLKIIFSLKKLEI